MKRITGQTSLCLMLLVVCSITVAAQESSETRDEFWPEVDVFVHWNLYF